ncbi:MAG TPA: tRNA uridine-5-carboxymethylaminomethyl(34) synthesis GTPase MnmE, partial [Thermodesulfovibrionales bacterium]|nr:tRNA uridine-5-carboxymethylaminomethyl(34) synthesis GTPase MnmE [Thermodesulfovibrionales bacterium]
MHSIEDTIAGISTPVGLGGIGIVRLTGPKAVAIAESVFRSPGRKKLSSAPSRRSIYGQVVDPADSRIVDEVLTTVMRAPNSYTREDVVEISSHGGLVSVRNILEIVVRQGARPADPGEFTKRAFLNGRLSLDQAEAVLDIISAKTSESMRIAGEQLRGNLTRKLADIRSRLIEISAYVEAYLDFPEDEIEHASNETIRKQLMETVTEIKRLSSTFDEARFFREGLSVAIVGRPNVGKSSLLNTLLQKDRAIVTDLPGTTRDLIEDFLNLNGLPVRITDTAGIRNSTEIVEQEGIRRSVQAIGHADFIVALFDGSEPLCQEDLDLLQIIRGKNAIAVIGKADLPRAINPDRIAGEGMPLLHLSTLTGEGVEELKERIFASHLCGWKEEREGVVVTNIRHKTALDSAAGSLE